MESFATPYPLIFHDGEQEQDKGFIGIHSMLTFKRFQALLGQKTGIPPNQLSAVFVCRKAIQGGSEQRQRLPISGNTNFSILLNQHNPSKERDCYFLISLKRSKKERKGSRKRGAESEVPDAWDISTPSGLEESGYLSNHLGVEEMLSAGSSQAAEATGRPLVTSTSSSKHSMEDGLPRGSNQVVAIDDNAGRIILKRGNTPFLRKREAFQADNFVPLNSPRFAALREEDRRDINWRWEDSFPRVTREQWGLQVPYAMPHYASIPTYHHHVCKNGSAGEAYGLGLYTNRELFTSPNHLKPKFQGLQAASSSLLREGDPYLERQARIQMSESLWQRMPGALIELPHESFRIDCGAHEETMPPKFCQLCFECKRRDVSPIPFHWCVEDAVIQGSRGPSPAGPIARRAKIQHVEVAAA